MPYRNFFFEKNQPFHIVSRAVEEREIFKDEADCYRYIFQLWAANIGSPAPNIRRRDVIKIARALLEGEKVSSKFIIREHDPLVFILDFSLVLTHFHLYLVANIENGIPYYMKKVNGGFAKFFNLKHQRKGTLFASRYKSIAVTTDFQSDAVSRYVSIINPLDIYQPGWRENGLKNWKEAFEFLTKYQFSSFPDKIGKRNSKIVASDEILEKYLVRRKENLADYIEFVKEFLKQKTSLSPFLIE